MAKEEKVKKQGQIIRALPNLRFDVKLEDDSVVHAHLAGRLKMYRIRVLPGDEVTVEMSPYDKTKGRIIWRGKKRDSTLGKINTGQKRTKGK